MSDLEFTPEYIAKSRKAKGGVWVFPETREALDEIERLQTRLADTKARLAAYESGFDPKAKKPKYKSDLEDEIVIFQDKMGRPYIGVFDTCIHKWCCITATQFMFSTDAIERWFPLPGRRGE